LLIFILEKEPIWQFWWKHLAHFRLFWRTCLAD